MQRFSSFVLIVALVSAAGPWAEEVAPGSERWRFSGAEHRVEQHLGRESLYLKGAMAWIADEAFTDGEIEFDIAFSEQRGFSGGVWRVLDDANHEQFYLRPHQSGNPDANQYTPVFHGLTSWQLYHGPGYGAPVDYRYDAWMHVKIVFAGTRGEVFIDSEAPVVALHELKRVPLAGSVGLTASDFAPAWFSNFSYRKLEQPGLVSAAEPPRSPPEGSVRTWHVSTGLPETSLDGKSALTAADKRGLEWVELAADGDGTANLGAVRPLSRAANTVFARVTLRSEVAETRRARFGYSDRVRVYLNDRLLYAGSNDYRSRDYRYLGTIGLFDEVSLPLRPGDNELWFAVSESFGGWGLRCVIEPPATRAPPVTPAGGR